MGFFKVAKDLSDWNESIEPGVSTADVDLARSWIGVVVKGDFSLLLF
jgi:hypothetical protein